MSLEQGLLNTYKKELCLKVPEQELIMQLFGLQTHGMTFLSGQVTLSRTKTVDLKDKGPRAKEPDPSAARSWRWCS